MFENRALKNIFGPKSDEVKLKSIRLYYVLNIPQNIIREMKSRRLRWTGYVARMGDRRSAERALVAIP
jgi:hypothetical protein